MLLDDLKARMFKAMKAGDTLEKEILRVAIGEITTDAAREGRKGNDEEAQALIRKLVKANEETLVNLEAGEKRDTLLRENQILSEFLPKSLSEDEIIAALAGVAEQVRAAGNDGQATGVAMKQLKASGALADGKAVTRAVQRMRSAG
ncbi:MAG: GatB/YqeY domain-containing protein [Polyangiaceae bacterium]